MASSVQSQASMSISSSTVNPSMVEENIGLQLKFSKLITYAFHTIQDFVQCADHSADFGNFPCPLVNKKHLEKGCFAQVVGNLGNGMEAVKTLSPPNPT